MLWTGLGVKDQKVAAAEAGPDQSLLGVEEAGMCPRTGVPWRPSETLSGAKDS